MILHKAPFYLLLDWCLADHMCLTVCLFTLASMHSFPFELQLQEYGIYDHVLLPPHGLAYLHLCHRLCDLTPTVYMLSIHVSDVCCLYLHAWTQFLAPAFPSCLMDIHESFSKRTNASLSSAPSGLVTSVGFLFMLAMHAAYGKILCCCCRMKLVHMVLGTRQN